MNGLDFTTIFMYVLMRVLEPITAALTTHFRSFHPLMHCREIFSFGNSLLNHTSWNVDIVLAATTPLDLIFKHSAGGCSDFN